MAGKETRSPTRKDQGESRAQPNQRLPKGNFNSDGLSQGKATGPVRPGWDAEQGPRPKSEESR